MMKKKSFLIITLGAYLLSSLLFFTSLDNKLFDLFLRVLPSLTEDEKVIVLTLDDDSINYAGGFPFRREVMADVVVLLKELGVETIAFDLSYLDESPSRFDPAYAARVFEQLLDQDFDFRDNLESSLSLLARDVDEYFAQSLAFSGCSWLTLTMLRPEDILDTANSEISANEERDRYLKEFIALGNVIDAGDTKTPQMADLMPAIQKLLSRSLGAGFVNASPDADGYRRRIHLLHKYKDSYYGQLTFNALQKKLDVLSIEASNSAITLNKNNGGKTVIPRSPDGSVLLKWPKKTFYDYQVMSLLKLIQHTLIEPAFANNIALMNDSGFFYFWDGEGYEAGPWEYYLAAEEIKTASYANNAAASDEWMQYRHSFFNSIENFLYGSSEEAILNEVGGDWEIEDFVRELFEVCRAQYERLGEIRKEAAVLQNSFCVIGSDATSMTDNGLTTFQENFPLVGTYTTVANMLLYEEFITEAPWYISAIIALVFSLLIGFLISRFDTYASIITGVSGLVVLSGASALFFFVTKIYPGFAVPLAATALCFISLMVSKFLSASNEKAFLHSAFSRYLAPEIISEMIDDPAKLNLGGEKRELTAIFTDIKGFSTISEQVDPTQLVKLLNCYLTELSTIVMENLGTIDKYIGDAIVAFFGAPVFHPNHAALACRSALAMKAAEKKINLMVKEEKLSPIPIFTRIGINTGEMVVGNMGAENKMDYTIMGNAVNLAARLEGVNKQYHTGGILISEYTKEKIGDEFLARRLDRVRVVGINTPLRLYELLDFRQTADKASLDAFMQWEKAIDFFEQKQFKEALMLFYSLMKSRPDDEVAKFYTIRSKEFTVKPPPPGWDAVNNLTKK